MIYLKDTQGNVNKLPVYKGKDGKDGINGKSAYELAVKNGYKGTEKEWLSSLECTAEKMLYIGDEAPTDTSTPFWINESDEDEEPVDLDEVVATSVADYFEKDNTFVKKIDINHINAKDFGAKGDGVTDDTTAIKNAILKAIEKGLKLYVPTGIYRINNSVNITDKSYIEMYGDGQDKTIFKAVDGLVKGSDMFTFWRIKHAVFHDFTVDGNSENNTDGNDIDGVHMFDTWNCEDIEIYNVTWQNNVYIGTRHANVKNLNIHHCKTLNTDVGICTISDTAENVEIKACQVEGHNKSEGISIYNKVLIKNVVIRDNIVQNKEKAMGICIGYQFDDTVINTQNVTIDNNKIFNTAAGIAVLNPGGVSENVFVTNNVIATASVNASHGISFKNAKNCKITNNIIDKACLRGVSLVGCDNVSVTNNTIMNYDASASNAVNSAIALEDSNNCIVHENTIQQNLEESNNGILLFKGTSTKNIFRNNKVLPSDTNTKSANLVGSSGNTATDNIIEYDYSGITLGVSGIDYTTNKISVNNYTHTLGNEITLYNKPYFSDLLLKITKSGVVLNPTLTILHEGAKKKIKVVASYAFTLANSDTLTWTVPNTYEAGTYYFELECRDGHWYELGLSINSDALSSALSLILQ